MHKIRDQIIISLTTIIYNYIILCIYVNSMIREEQEKRYEDRSQHVVVGIVQTNGTLGDVDANVDLLDKYAFDSCRKENRPQILAFPELFLSGYAIGKERMKELAKKIIEENTIENVCKIAEKYEMVLIIGYPELEGNYLYNTAITVDHTGNIVSKYRKTHLFNEYEKQIFSSPHEAEAQLENAFPVFNLKLRNSSEIRISVLICYDIEFPEPCRMVALEGADLIVVPTANTNFNSATVLAKARALENQLFVAYVNRMGKETETSPFDFCGLSALIGPNGQYVALAKEKEEIIYGTVDFCPHMEFMNENPYLKDRLPTLYQALSEKEKSRELA